MCRSWRCSKPRCWQPFGHWSKRAAAFSIARARSSATKERTRLMRFLHTTPMPVCCPPRVICCRKAGGLPVASRTIPWVSTTVSSTPCWKSTQAEARRPAWLAWGLALVLAWLAFWQPLAHADAPNTEVTQLKLERGDDGVYLSAMVQFNLPSLVEEVLEKGIAIYFVAEAEIYRERW